MTAYLTREAWEHLMVAVRDDSGTVFQQHQRICATLDSLPVVDAVPAEEALGRLVLVARGLGSYGLIGPPDATAYTDEAAVRHALRAAQAQAEENARLREALERPLVESLPDLVSVPAKDGARVILRAGDLIDALLRMKKAQADAPPPPDVIRRGHEWVAKIAETVERTRTCKGADHPEVAEILDAIEAGIPDARAAMHKLPKEE